MKAPLAVLGLVIGVLGLGVLAGVLLAAAVVSFWALQAPLDPLKLPALLVWIPTGLVVMFFTGQRFRSDGP